MKWRHELRTRDKELGPRDFRIKMTTSGEYKHREHKYRHPSEAIIVTIEGCEECDAHERLADLVTDYFPETSAEDWRDV